jgi:hypothetical protein
VALFSGPTYARSYGCGVITGEKKETARLVYQDRVPGLGLSGERPAFDSSARIVVVYCSAEYECRNVASASAADRLALRWAGSDLVIFANERARMQTRPDRLVGVVYRPIEALPAHRTTDVLVYDPRECRIYGTAPSDD